MRWRREEGDLIYMYLLHTSTLSSEHSYTSLSINLHVSGSTQFWLAMLLNGMETTLVHVFLGRMREKEGNGERE